MRLLGDWKGMATLHSFLVCSYKGGVLTMATDVVQFELSVRAFDNGLLLRAKLGAIDAMAEIQGIGTFGRLEQRRSIFVISHRLSLAARLFWR
jgi:hypothetical protein